jgi:hypothetical protein
MQNESCPVNIGSCGAHPRSWIPGMDEWKSKHPLQLRESGRKLLTKLLHLGHPENSSTQRHFTHADAFLYSE